MIGLSLNEALELVGDKKVEILYNNSDKLADFDSQLVVAYKETSEKIIFTVSNFKLKVE